MRDIHQPRLEVTDRCGRCGHVVKNYAGSTDEATRLKLPDGWINIRGTSYEWDRSGWDADRYIAHPASDLDLCMACRDSLFDWIKEV